LSSSNSKIGNSFCNIGLTPYDGNIKENK